MTLLTSKRKPRPSITGGVWGWGFKRNANNNPDSAALQRHGDTEFIYILTLRLYV